MSLIEQCLKFCNTEYAPDAEEPCGYYTKMSFPDFLSARIPEGYNPYRSQMAIAHNLEYFDDLIVKQARCVGVTTVLRMFAAHYAVKNPGAVVMLLGTTNHITMQDICETSQYLNECVRDKSTRDMIKLTNGSVIKAFRENRGGKNPDLIIVDHGDISDVIKSLAYRSVCTTRLIVAQSEGANHRDFNKLWESDLPAARLTILPDHEQR